MYPAKPFHGHLDQGPLHRSYGGALPLAFCLAKHLELKFWIIIFFYTIEAPNPYINLVFLGIDTIFENQFHELKQTAGAELCGAPPRYFPSIALSPTGSDEDGNTMMMEQWAFLSLSTSFLFKEPSTISNIDFISLLSRIYAPWWKARGSRPAGKNLHAKLMSVSEHQNHRYRRSDDG
ncbi:hypothetical protein OPV22_028749 [Ensete ventricosum]|uniref:Uncharacterized protein n=1 Tax=Ensete ventricosum TaxID=4639 RepID=A0AAV8P6M9_ENSVE|nr:hypothetical protein OPV22_028749 [Ensete ventricosum]